MSSEEAESPPKKLSRKQFLKGIVAGSFAAALSSACQPQKPETASVPESVINQLKIKLDSAFTAAGENLAVGMVEEQFPGYLISEGNTSFFCLPAGGSEQENPYQIGFLKSNEHLFLHHRVVTVNKENQKKEAWNVLLFNQELGLPDKWEFVKIGGWDEKKMDEQLKKNKDYLINVNDQLALFCFDGPETKRINQTPSEPIFA